jgi:succinoglycan biosynthesis transport protein ExoP
MNDTQRPQPVPPVGQSHAYYYGAPAAGAGDGISPSPLNPGNLLQVCLRNWLTIFLCLLIAAGLAWAYLHFTQPEYRAGALIELSARRPRFMPIQGAVIEDQGGGQLDTILNTRLEKIKGFSMLSNAVRRAATVRPDLLNATSDLSAYLRSRTTFALIRRTPLLRIEVTHQDPELAALFCNTLAEAIEEGAVEENRAASDAAVLWLEAQAKNQRLDLQTADDALLRFRKENDLASLENQRRNAESAMAAFNNSLVAVESDASKQADLVKALQGIDLRPENSGKLPSNVPRETEIQEALGKWIAALAERSALLSRYTEKHPEVEAKDKMIELLKRQASEALNRAVATANANLSLYQKQADSLRKMKSEQARQANDLSLTLAEQTMRLTALERARDASDTAYRGLLTRIQEARMAADENTATVKIIERAAVPLRAYWPNPRSTVLLALAGGVLAGLLLSLLKELLQNHIISPQDVEAHAGVKVLAAVPHMRARARKDLARACLSQQSNRMVEAFAGLRTSIDVGPNRSKNRVIVVSSAVPQEGKTTTCCNLAISLARNGERTLLIDFDLRRPRVGEVFSVPEDKRALLTALAVPDVQMDFAGLVISGPCDNLSLITTRVVPSVAAADVIGGRRAADLVAWARERYDRVILDAPPLGLISDAIVLAGRADMALVVVRPGVSKRRLTRHVVQRFREAGLQNIAAVVNDLRLMHAGYGQGVYQQYYAHYDEHYRGAAEPQAPAGDSRTPGT